MRRIRWIKGGTIWTEDGPVEADLALDPDGKIDALVDRRGPTDERPTGPDVAPGPPVPAGLAGSHADPNDVLDATGLWVLPGAVDVHVHFREPGLTASEDFGTGSAAAACGGVTTVLDMPNTLPPVSDAATLRAKMEAIAGRSYVDYGLFGAAVAGDEGGLIERVEAMAEAGACGIKVFLGPTTGDIAAPGWGALYRLCRHLGGRGPVLTFHCEDRDVIEAAAVGRGRLNPGDYRSLLELRPRFGELLATQGVLLLALETGARVHIAHVALKEAVSMIGQAKEAGAPVTAETCPQYLFVCDEDFAWAGRQMKALPPIRSAEDREALWRGLADGALDTIATDHAPHRTKELRDEAVWAPPFGIAGVQTLLPLLLDHAISGACRVSDVVRWTSSNPARAYGLYPRKGALVPGADGDVVLVDPGATWRCDDPWWKGKSRNTPFWGRIGKGLPVVTLLGGRVVAEGGHVVGSPRGKLVAGSF